MHYHGLTERQWQPKHRILKKAAYFEMYDNQSIIYVGVPMYEFI